MLVGLGKFIKHGTFPPLSLRRSARHLQIKTKLLKKKKTANPRARIAARFNLRVAKTLSLGLGGLIGGNAPTGHLGFNRINVLWHHKMVGLIILYRSACPQANPNNPNGLVCYGYQCVMHYERGKLSKVVWHSWTQFMQDRSPQ